ncbi:MAG: hypothetical protein PG979_001437 [Rickettsia asembonensis]|nr:MAG: hypothetical protein PG979_001437 [Rickettsia asembonensis]
MILNNLKRYSLALESFDKAIELAPNEANAYADKAIVLSHYIKKSKNERIFTKKVR